MSHHDLSGRIIAVAGAGGGLGPTVLDALADAGATVAAAERSTSLLEALDADHTHAVDLLDEAAAKRWCATVEDELGGVDGLVHLVGGWRGGEPLETAPLEDYRVLHDLLVRTLQHTTRAFLPALKRSGRGRLVGVTSKVAQRPEHTGAAYAAAKAAADAWTFACADGLKEHGGTANLVAVNAIVTPRMRAADPGKAFATFTDAGEISGAIAFLLSDAARKMNGQRLSLHPA